MLYQILKDRLVWVGARGRAKPAPAPPPREVWRGLRPPRPPRKEYIRNMMIKQRYCNRVLLALLGLVLLAAPAPSPTAAAAPAPPLVTPLAGAVRLDWRGDVPALHGLGAATQPLVEI